jgi:hypothetical protein
VDPVLVPGRSCGTCNVCCVVPTIDDRALQKLPGYRCHNALPNGACAIYQARPRTCQEFFCGWRRLKWIREDLRPDSSGVFVMVINEATLEPGVNQVAVTFTLLDGASPAVPGFAEVVAAAIQANVSAYLVVPGLPGFTANRMHLNEVLVDPVRQRDKAAVLRIIEEMRAEALVATVSQPVIFASYEDGGAEPHVATSNDP